MSENSKDSTRTNLPNDGKIQAMTHRIAAAAILAALAVILMYLEIPLPFMPPFLKFDFSEIPVLVGSFALGPVYGVIIEFLKNLIHLPVTGTQGIGEFSNFITGSIYVFSAGFIYMKNRNKKFAIIGMLTATIILAAIAVPFNYFVTLPLYGSVLGFPLEAIIGMSAAVNSLIKDKLTLIFFGFVPFNLFKGFVVAFITFFIYKPISGLINRTYKKTRS